MSALNVIRTADAVHVLTDGLAATTMTSDAEPIGAMSKVLILPHLNAVVAVRGWAFMLFALYTNMNMGATSFDDLKANAPDIIRQSLSDYRTLHGASPNQGNDVVIAGWSETTGPDSFIVCTHAGNGIPEWTPVDLIHFSMMPGDPELEDRIREAMPHVSSLEEFDPERDGLTVLEMQHQAYSYSVGAFAQITTVREDGIYTKILQRWPVEVAG